jgi:hypothetical protein
MTDDIRGGWRKFDKDKFHSWHSTPNIIKTETQRAMDAHGMQHERKEDKSHAAL